MASGASETFALDLESNIADVATAGADALEELRESIALDTQALGNMQKAMRQLQGSASVDIGTFRQLRAQIAAQKATVAQNTATYVQAGGTFRAIKKPIDDSAAAQKRAAAEAAKNAAEWKKYFASLKADQLKAAAENARELKAGLQELPGPLGRFVSMLGGGAVAAVVGITVAIVALTAASIAAVASLVGYAIAMGDARRSEELRLQGLSKYRNFWAEMVPGMRRAADSSTFLQSQLDAVADSSALGRDRIGEMQAELYRAGLRSGNLQAALEGLAIAESTQGAEGAAQFKARALGAAIYGGSVKKLSDDIKARLGGIAKAQLLSLDVQQRKLKENFARLFSSIKLDALLQAVHSVVEMFSASTAGGRALKALIDGLIQPLIDGVATAGPYIKRFFQGVIIAALLFGITILKVRNLLRDTFGDSTLFEGLDVGRMMVLAGAAAFGALAGLIAGCVAIMVALGAAAVAAATVIALPFIIAYGAVTGLIGVINGLRSELSSSTWKEAGQQLVDGMVDGITLGAPKAIRAVVKLGGDMIGAFRKAFDMHSPSKLMRRESFNIPAGAALGVNDGAPVLRRSGEGMADATQRGMQDGFARGGGRMLGERAEAQQRGAAAAGAISVTVAPGAIVVQGGDERGNAALAEEIMLKLEERIVHAARAVGGSI